VKGALLGRSLAERQGAGILALSQQSRPLGDESLGCSSLTPWEVCTKYYVAPVRLGIVHSELGAVEGRCEALVHVVDGRGLTSAGLREELTALCDGVELSCDVQLVVMSHADEWGGDRWFELPEAVGELSEAALDCGFELVPADLASPECGSGSRERIGVARVVEALETVMWSSMVRGGKPAASTAMSKAEADSSSSVAASSSSSSSAMSKGVSAAAAAEPATSTTATVEEEEEAVGGAGKDDAEQLHESDRGDDVDPEQDSHFESLERMMEEARAMRAAGATMSDAQRRDRAADVAMRLAALLGFDDGEVRGMIAEVHGESK
jgi:hypothetical protein